VIGVNPLPEVKAGPDRMLVKGATATLAGEVKGSGMTYTWTPVLYLSDPNNLNPQVSATEDIIYTLTAQSSYGCTNKDEAWVKVANDLYIPNAFTPNGDGVNDIWRIPFLDPFLEAKVSIYNRYGQRVYYSQGTIVFWDGTYQNKTLPAEVYIYVIDLTKAKRILNGIVTIVR
jgi:gliding motility-associated-like protein